MRTFLSSTYIDLVKHREKAVEALERLDHQVVRMEIFGARSDEPSTASLHEVHSCDLFVGVYAHRYGFVPAGHSLSITEKEFREARHLHKHMFCFVVANDYLWRPTMIEMNEPGRLRLIRFKERIDQRFVRGSFTDPTDLAYQIATSVSQYLQNTYQESARPLASNPYSPLLDSAPNLAEILGRTIDALRHVTQTDYNQIFLAAHVEKGLRPVEVAYATSTRKNRYSVASLDGLIGSVFLTGNKLNIGVVREEADYIQAVVETRAELIVPVKIGGVVVGVFNSESEVENHYSPAICAPVDQLAEALGYALTRVGWRPGTPIEELPNVRCSLD
jgi:putative methionine-R-sulfoxide reductase with GAF domain